MHARQSAAVGQPRLRRRRPRAIAAEIQKTFSREDILTSYGRFGLAPKAGETLYEEIYPLAPGSDTLVGSTDVGTVSWVVPTVQCRVACYAVGTPGHSWQLVAQGRAPAAHKGLEHAAKAMAAVAVNVLRDPGAPGSGGDYVQGLPRRQSVQESGDG